MKTTCSVCGAWRVILAAQTSGLRVTVNQNQQHVFYFVNEAERFAFTMEELRGQYQSLASGKTFDWEACQNLR